MITLVAAAGEKNELGGNNEMLWHLSDDFKRFKKITTDHFIIMGRKTFESLGKPLPNRVHIVITRDRNYCNEDALVVHSLGEALEKAASTKDVFIIGGGEIFKQSLDLADKIELTRVHGTFEEADTFFPKFSKDKWNLVSEEKHEKDAKHKYSFTYETWIRK